MANTITVTKTTADQWKNPQGWFETVWTVSGSFADQDAILATAIGEFDITVPGVAVGDMIVGKKGSSQ